MGYLAQKTRISKLVIGGQDYTSSMVSWTASDSSANERGLVKTTGTVLLGQQPGGPSLEDYDRNIFKRGTLVTLDMKGPQGNVFRHPRGYLYVVGVSYNVENQQLEVGLGCRLVLATITDDPSELLPLTPMELDESRQTIQNCDAAFASAGQVCFQNNVGNLEVKQFFDGDSLSGTAPGQWVSVLGVTALAVSPLAGSDAIPDQIKLSYSQPASFEDGDVSRVDTQTSISKYWINYPAATFKRTANFCAQTHPEDPDKFIQVACISTIVRPTSGSSSSSGRSTSCGNYGSAPRSGR